ncbi:hypothetical protein PP657_gp090 [Bacillus phage BCPST]|uniref:Uncharacterized protein n=1 Tax=Bacillus phage BCPST TaxID=2801506 RepID=A0AAE7P3M1_9CAUD|nr:hypothetical protein PP657_gp090 [Bacillus phage BCPST]QQO38732.1 hypothetical protein BCPST_114 [Bacillus phage BCPST]QSJ04317.1 hypothetical protein BCP6_113 [Bacillus phage BCP6]
MSKYNKETFKLCVEHEVSYYNSFVYNHLTAFVVIRVDKDECETCKVIKRLEEKG